MAHSKITSKKIDGWGLNARESILAQQTTSGSLTVTGTATFNSSSKIPPISGGLCPMVTYVGTSSAVYATDGYTGHLLSPTGSGGVVFLGIDGGDAHRQFDRTHVNLPAPEAGLNYQFIISSSYTQSGSIKVTATSDGKTPAQIMYGLLSCSVGDTTDGTKVGTHRVATGNKASYSIWFGSGSHNSTPAGHAYSAADNAYVICDGTNWYAHGMSFSGSGAALVFDSASIPFEGTGSM